MEHRIEIRECPTCGREIELKEPLIGGTFVVRCQTDGCWSEMETVRIKSSSAFNTKRK